MSAPAARPILVADDDAAVLELVKTHLTADGYTVITCSTGKEAMAQVRAESPALVVIDMMLPELNGLQFVHQMKTDERTRRIPVILMSSLIETGGSKSECDEADYLLAKPIHAAPLLAKIRELLNAPAQPTPSSPD